jgi:hypothetical protein
LWFGRSYVGENMDVLISFVTLIASWLLLAAELYA